MPPENEDPPSFREAFRDGITMSGRFGKPASTYPPYDRAVVICSCVIAAAVIGACAFLVVKGYPVAAVELLPFASFPSPMGRAGSGEAGQCCRPAGDPSPPAQPNPNRLRGLLFLRRPRRNGSQTERLWPGSSDQVEGRSPSDNRLIIGAAPVCASIPTASPDHAL